MSQIILITGASSGFGQATAKLLASQGYIIYGTSRKPHTDTDGTHYLQMDVCDRESVNRGVNHIIAREGHLDVLINNAGIGIGGAIEDATPEEIRLQMETNFMGTVNLCQCVLPHMRQQRHGLIINLSSIGGVMGLPYQGFYSASKFAVEGFTEALAAEVRGLGIRVTMIEPGDFATGFTNNRLNSHLTPHNPAYQASFARSLDCIEREERNGLNPDIMARRIAHIIRRRHPRLRYVVANLEQRLSLLLKRLLPGNWFVSILRRYYKV